MDSCNGGSKAKEGSKMPPRTARLESDCSKASSTGRSASSTMNTLGNYAGRPDGNAATSPLRSPPEGDVWSGLTPICQSIARRPRGGYPLEPQPRPQEGGPLDRWGTLAQLVTIALVAFSLQNGNFRQPRQERRSWPPCAIERSGTSNRTTRLGRSSCKNQN